MRILQASYRSGAEFLRHYQPAFAEGGLFYPTRESIELGTVVLVEVRLPQLPQRVLVRGRVAWRRPGRNRTKLRAGLGIEFSIADVVRRDFLLRVARGEVAQVPARKHRRLPVDMPAMWRITDGRHDHDGQVEDISAGGAFLRSSAGSAPTPGTEVVVELVPPGGVMALAIAGRIAWVRAGDLHGFGVEFRSRDAGGMRRLKELVRRLEAAESAELIPFEEDDTEVDDLEAATAGASADTHESEDLTPVPSA